MLKKILSCLLIFALFLTLLTVPMSASYYGPSIVSDGDYENLHISKNDKGRLLFFCNLDYELCAGFGYALYKTSLTGQESQDVIRQKAVSLLNSKTSPLRGSETAYTNRFCFPWDFPLDGSELETGNYLLVLYYFSYALNGYSFRRTGIYSDTMYTTIIHVVDQDKPNTGAKFFTCEEFGENRQYVSSIELKLGELRYLGAERTTPNATGEYTLQLSSTPLDNGRYVLEFPRYYPGRIYPGYSPIYANHCGTTTVQATWLYDTYRETNEAGNGPYELKVTVACDYPETGTVTREPACGVPGIMEYTCTCCGVPKEEEIPALEHALPEEGCTIIQDHTATQPGVLGGNCIHCGEYVTLPYAPIFSDTKPTSYYAQAVDYCYENNLFKGTSATKFSPNLAMNRGMAVTVLHRLEGCPEAQNQEIPFSDVESDDYYAQATLWAAENSIVSGNSDGTFRPKNQITREQLAAILYRYAQYKGLDTEVSPEVLDQFEDKDTVSSYALAPMAWAVENGLINGVKATVLQPKGNATRAQVATIVYRFVQAFMEQP